MAPLLVNAQKPPASGAAVVPAPPRGVMIHRELGKWWTNSELASKMNLTDNQITQLDTVFYQHRMNLIDYRAELEKQELKLDSLLNSDHPEEGQVNGQLDQVLAARAKLEREFTAMTLDLRRVLSPAQWRQLRSHRPEPGAGDRIFFRSVPAPPGAGAPFSLPVPPPPDLE
jgi:Spy/CpxP family protein refolding chaperone